jgi:hypothetical protein
VVVRLAMVRVSLGSVKSLARLVVPWLVLVRAWPVRVLLVLMSPVSARVAQRVERSDRLGIPRWDRLVMLVPVRFGSLPVGSTMRRLARRLVFARVPVKAEGQWRAARLER